MVYKSIKKDMNLNKKILKQKVNNYEYVVPIIK